MKESKQEKILDIDIEETKINCNENNIPKDDKEIHSNNELNKNDITEVKNSDKNEDNGRNNTELGEKNKSVDNHEWKNSLLIFVSTKTGLNYHNVLYIPTIARLLKFPQSIGILGKK